jgi:hypothetical protein
MLKEAVILTRPAPTRRDASFHDAAAASEGARPKRRENVAGGLFQHP